VIPDEDVSVVESWELEYSPFMVPTKLFSVLIMDFINVEGFVRKELSGYFGLSIYPLVYFPREGQRVRFDRVD
jgi:hypothetical protein